MSVRIELRNVRHGYGKAGPAVLHDFSLDVSAGAFVTVLGPSGSGKSTLLALIAGIESLRSGDILFDGRSVLTVPAQKRGVALVLQQPYLFPYLTVGENVTFGLAARGVSRRTRVVEADRWLTRVGLDGMAGRRPRELSGGEQQRVALVRAIATDPRVLLMDEPLASLDPHVRESLQTMLRAIVSETAVTSVMVTHDLSEAMSLGDRTALLDDGRLVAEGPSQRLFHHPPNRTAAEFVGISTFIEGFASRGSLTTPAGQLRVDGLAEDSGRRTIVAIRPEHVRLVDQHGPNTVPGVITECTFRGEYWDTSVDTALGRLRARGDSPLPSGSMCNVEMPARHLFAVEDETHGE